jgi:glycosyltransferase involved in cell wall biosynthesis
MIERQLSLCITTFNRFEMTVEAFYNVYYDDRISEIIIVDDASDIEIFKKLKEVCDAFPKVRLIRNAQNRDCYFNKATAIGYASNDYVIIMDSDNLISHDYIDKIFAETWAVDTVLLPTFAKPHFDYRAFTGLIITRENVAEYMGKPMFATALNTMNYFVHKNTYLNAFDADTDPVTADSIFQNMNLLKKGDKLVFVDGLEYTHNVHSGSHYVNNVSRTPNGFYEKVEQELLNLK